MHTGLLITTVIGATLIFYQLLKWNNLKKAAAPVLASGVKRSPGQELPGEEAWWMDLDQPIQLELAVALAIKALPVWEKYSKTNDLLYKNSPVGPSVSIRPELLGFSLQQILQASVSRFPAGTKEISNSCNEFIAPLVALQDGHWKVAYPVKKIFLAVYYILKAITEQDNIPVTKNLLSASINQSLDCLDMCKLYSREEIRNFLHAFRVRSAV